MQETGRKERVKKKRNNSKALSICGCFWFKRVSGRSGEWIKLWGNNKNDYKISTMRDWEMGLNNYL